MQLTFQSSASIGLILASTLLLNACGNQSQARTQPTANAPATTASAKPVADSDCDALDKTSFEVEAALMGLGIGTEMGSSMIADNVDRTQAAIAKVAALKPKAPKIKALQTQYLNLAQAALKPVAPLTKPGNEKALFFVDCKK
jgi:hypothetical protein